jgi:regulator of protease activity HflC (stomatin/prohibitin superfamily)
MSLLIEKLFDLLREWFLYLLPFYVMGDDQCGLVRRFRLYHRNLKPGWNWKIPVLESTHTEVAALDSTVLREQTLTTSDGKSITIRGCIAYRVVDPRKYILDCATAVSVINDVGCCVLAEIVPTLESEMLLKGEIDEFLLQAMRKRARRWGIRLESVGLVDRVQTRTYRILTDGGDQRSGL